MEKQNLIENTKKLCAQIRIDDLEESPESAYELFQCECCGELKMVAGSLLYSNYRLCNDCVFLAETGFALEEFSDVQVLIDRMEESRFETVYNSLFKVDENSMN